jgi:HNH endonuclease/AP2 domain-containing protein
MPQHALRDPSHGWPDTNTGTRTPELTGAGSLCRRQRQTIKEPPDMTAYIPLTKGQFAIVDDEDFAFLSQWKWQYSGRYAVRTGPRPSRKNIWMHRLIINPPEGLEVDHINRNRLDNRRCNLRVVTHSFNIQNSPIQKHTSGYRGVYWNKERQKWSAGAGGRKQFCWLGYFRNELDAARAYDQAARELFGPDAQVNFPDATTQQGVWQ